MVCSIDGSRGRPRPANTTRYPSLAAAEAAGYRACHRYRVLTDVFNDTPRELRARRRVSDRLQADGGLAIRLAHDKPLNFTAALRHLAERATPTVEMISGACYRRTILVDHDPA
jgi:AraC family transcriptional regulator of adaptative response / DNA-3-methyladenine glycosylase II